MPKNLNDSLRSLTSNSAGQTSYVDRVLPPAPQPAPIPARTGQSTPSSSSSASAGGIASPLTETAYADREWYAEQTIRSSDGMFNIRVKPIKTLKFTDANSAPVVLEFAAKT